MVAYQGRYSDASFELPAATETSLRGLVTGAEEYRQTGRWLDLGFGEGGLLTVAARLGWHCFGTELAEASLAYGRNAGWTVSATPESDSRFAAGSFDVVSLIELLEHVPDPSSLLRSVVGWLRPGGVLLATTPNALSLNARLLRHEWSIIRPPEHCVIWTAAAARRACAQAGLSLVRLRSHGFNPSQLVSRFRKGREDFTVRQRNAAALALNMAFTSNPARRGVKALLNGLLSVTGLGDTLKLWAVRRS